MRALMKSLMIAALCAAIPGWAAAQDQQNPPSQSSQPQAVPTSQPSQPSESGQAQAVPANQPSEPGQAQAVPTNQPTQVSQSTPLEQVVERVIQREHEEIKTLRRLSPLVETYIQDMRPDKEFGMVPVKDHYFIGVAELSKGVVEQSMLDKKKGRVAKLNPFGGLSGAFSSSYVPEGFLQMIYIDTGGFDRQHYRFDYVRREFLGEVRCLVFDLTPLQHSGNGRFKGRIWVEDQDYNIVRFNGVYVPQTRMFGTNVHFDSWRVNPAPGLWLPAYVYSEESDLHDFLYGHIRFKSQTRLWGYDLKGVGHQEEFSQLTVDSATPVKDQAQEALDRSPVDARRAWQRQAEENVIDRLQRAGLIAPTGEVDKVMETVVNNIEVTNNVDIQPEVKCRVMLTATLESFTIGHTIVLSRGLLDVLPDEGTLAAMLAHELGHVMLGQPLDDKWAFNDETLVSTQEALQHFTFHANAADEEAASTKAIELLKNSPYKDKLTSAGLFMRQLESEQKQLPALISSHMGNRVFKDAKLENSAPALDPKKLDQIAALPLGARVKLNPWTDQAELVKAKPAAILSERDKMPFEVTPFYPYLTRFATASATIPAADASKTDMAKKQP
jgi:hypothetical protein